MTTGSKSKPMLYSRGPRSSIRTWAFSRPELMASLKRGFCGYVSRLLAQPPAVRPFHSPVTCNPSFSAISRSTQSLNPKVRNSFPCLCGMQQSVVFHD